MSDIQIIIQDQEDISLEVQSDSEGVTEVSVSAPVSVEVVQNAVFNFSTGDGTAPGATVLDELNDVQVGSSANQGEILFYDVTAGKWIKGDYDDIAGIPDLNALLPQGGLDDQFLKVLPPSAAIPATTYEWDYVEKLHLPVKNATGASIPAGSAVYASGIQGNSILIGLASASSSATMPAIGIVLEEILDGDSGEIITAGSYNKTISGFSGLSVGDTIYVSETAGELTSSKPQGTALIQNIGVVLQTNGIKIQKMKVSAIDRVNDIPNLPEGYIWYGDVNGVAQATDLSTLVPPAIWTQDGTIVYYNDGNVGIGTATPSEKLHVEGNIFMSEGSQLRSQTTDPTAGAQAQSLEFFLPYRSDGVTMAENKSGLMLGGVKFFEPRTTNGSTLHVFQGVNLAGTNGGAGGVLSLNLGSSSDQYPATSVNFGWANVGNTTDRRLRLYGYFGADFAENASGQGAFARINTTGLALGHTNPTAPIDIEAAANAWHIKADEYGYVGWKGGATQYFQGWSGRIVTKFDGTEAIRFRSNGIGIGTQGDFTPRLAIKAEGDDNTTTSILVNNSSNVEMFKVVDDGTVHTKDIKIADTKSFGADGGETINFVKYSGAGVVTFQSDASSNFEFGGGVLVENTTGLMFSDTVAGANKLSAGTHETFNFGKNGTGQANYTFTNEVCDVRFENTCDVVFANSGSVVFGSLEVGTNPTCPSFVVNATRLMYRHSNACDESEAVVIDNGGVISQSATNGIAVTIGGSIELRRTGASNPRMTINDQGFVMTGFFDWSTVTNTNPKNNGGGLHIGGDDVNNKTIISTNSELYFGPISTSGVPRIYFGNPYVLPSPSKTDPINDNWRLQTDFNFMNTQRFRVRSGVITDADAEADFDIISHVTYRALNDTTDDAAHGLQLSAVPNLVANNAGANGNSLYTATNGSGDLVATNGIRAHVVVGSVVYVEDAGDGGDKLNVGSATITRHVVTAVDSGTNTITVDPVFSGTTGNVSVFVQKNVVTFRDFAGDPIMRVQGNKNVAIGMNESPERLSITGRVHLDDGLQNIYIGSSLGSPIAAAQNVILGVDSFNNAGVSLANVLIGYQAGKEITSSGQNVFVGAQAGKEVTEGTSNTYVGYRAGSTNDLYDFNVAVGAYAQENFVGQQSTAVGYLAGRNATGTHTIFGYNAGITIGQGAVMLGYAAGAGSTTTVDTVVGQESYRNVTAGGANVAVGHQVMWSAESAKSLSDNISVGNGSMYMAYGSQKNVAIGSNAFRGYAGDEVTPGQGDTPNQVTAFSNVTIGYRSMYRAWNNASENVFIGDRAAYSDVGGGQETNTYNQNVGVGAFVGYDIESGVGNVMVGYQSGYNLTTGDKNVLLGWKAGSQLTTESNKLYIANSDTTTPLIEGDFGTTKVVVNNVSGANLTSPAFEVKTNTGSGSSNWGGGIGVRWDSDANGQTAQFSIGAYDDGSNWNPRLHVINVNKFDFTGSPSWHFGNQIVPAAGSDKGITTNFHQNAYMRIAQNSGANYAVNAWIFRGEGTNGDYSVNQPGLPAYNAQEVMRIQADGKVGIGVSAPETELHVDGVIKIGTAPTAYQLPSADGAAGYVLKTNGSGVVTWQADNAGTGGGASVIGDLNDVESTLGAAGEILQVDATGTTLEYIDGIDGITYTNATPMPEAVGGFAAGTTFNAQSLQQMFDGLLYPYQVPTLTLTTNLSSTYEYGTTVSSVTFTLTGTNLGNINSSYSLERSVNGTWTSLTTGTLAQINAYVDNNGGTPFDLLPNQSIFYRVTATDVNNNTIQDDSPSAYWRVRLFWGNSSNASETSVFNLTSANNSILDNNRQGVRSFDAGSGVYKYIAIPQAPTDLNDPPAAPNGFKLANGTNVPMATSTSTVPFVGASSTTTSNGYECKSITDTVNGKTVTYNLYRSENQLNGALTIEVF